MTTWNPLEEPVDFVLLNGLPTSGVIDFGEVARKYNWSKLNGPGLAGGFVVYRGQELIEFDLLLRLYDETDWAVYNTILPLLQKPTNAFRPQALTISHPLLDMLSPPLRAVVCSAVTLPQKTGEDGLYTAKVSLIEYRKPKVSYGAPQSAAETTTDPVDKRIEALTAQVQKLMPGGQ